MHDSARARTASAVGRAGEALAASVLERKGMHVLARRYRRRGGEIDLVAEDGDVVVFVEVKTRRTPCDGGPAAAVGVVKLRRLRRTAERFLAERGWGDRRTRFDVIEIVGAPEDLPLLRHLVDAVRFG